VFSNVLLPTAQPALAVVREGTPQNFASLKDSTKQYVSTNNADPEVMSIKIN
jgi:hypothetical protein